jgi:hypothetical protein
MEAAATGQHGEEGKTMTVSELAELTTLPALAKRLGVAGYRLKYARSKLGLEPVRRLGGICLFDAKAAEAIAAFVAGTPDGRRRPRPAEAAVPAA